ncbi:MAG: nuclease [Oscillochloris sp.]|nr:nuclease [Oscillochloris sp.]
MDELTDDQVLPSPDALAEIMAAADGLLLMSESDYPFTPFRWPGPESFSVVGLLEYLGLPPDTAVETRTLAAFFEPMATEQDWFDDDQRAAAIRFAVLRDRITSLLADVCVYRLGRVQITVIIVGLDATGASVGLQSTLIET